MTETAEGTLLWEPSEGLKESSNMTRYMRWLEERKGLSFPGYHELWEWSVEDLEAFWESVWEFCGVKASRPYERVLGRREMPGAEWFPGAELNYAENIFANARPGEDALISVSELRPLSGMSWEELRERTAALAAALREAGVGLSLIHI